MHDRWRANQHPHPNQCEPLSGGTESWKYALGIIRPFPEAPGDQIKRLIWIEKARVALRPYAPPFTPAG